jgi:integrase
MSVRKRTWTTSKGERRQAWIVDYRDRSGDRCQETFARKKDADARHAEVGMGRGDGTLVAPSRSATVAEAGKTWLDAAEARGLERGTLLQYRQHLILHIVPFIGSLKLPELAPATVTMLEDRLRKESRSPSMVRKVRVSLGQLLASAQERGLVARNVVRDLGRTRGFGRERQAERRVRGKLKVGVDIPQPAEIAAIIANTKERWRPLILVAAFTGLRASELRGLRWPDVDLEAGQLHVRQRADRYNELGKPKSAAGERVVPFGKIVGNTLREWRLACPRSEGDLVFPNGAGHVEALGNIIRRGFIPAQVTAGVTGPGGGAKYTGFHALRHFYASWCINRRLDGGRELPPKSVQERLGHSSITLTLDRYGHLFPSSDDHELDAAELALVSAK